MDKKDSKVLMELQRDSKRKVTSIAKDTGLPISTTHLRIKKLEDLGIIKGYRALIDHKKIGRPEKANSCHWIILQEKPDYQTLLDMLEQDTIKSKDNKNKEEAK